MKNDHVQNFFDFEGFYKELYGMSCLLHIEIESLDTINNK